MQNNPIAKAVRYALTAGVAATFIATPSVVYAAEEESSDEKITITGSRIKRVDIEGPSPVTVISREDIDASGDASIADVLRSSAYNSFGSFRDQSGVGEGAGGNANISLRGMGSNRTLILIDGRRTSPSASFNASTQNLNMIPFAAVERIEILRDGASAIYGSDAIAGVINIILRKDYEGVQFTGTLERPSQEGADSNAFSMVAGVSSAKGNITFAFDHYDRDPLSDQDRDFTQVGISWFGFPATYWDNGAGEFAVGPNCPQTGIGTDAQYPDSDYQSLGDFTPGGDSSFRCAYNYAADSWHSAALRRDSIFINANYELTDDVNMYTRMTVAHQEARGRYAPAPVTTPAPTMAANNPNHPCLYYQATDPTSEFATCSDITLYYRNVPAGNRDTTTDNVNMDLLLGFEGSNEWFGGSDWDVGVTHARAHVTSLSQGLANKLVLQSIIDDGSLDIFEVNGPLDQDVANTMKHLGVYDAETKQTGLDGSLSFDLFQMDSGPVSTVVGFEYYDLNFYKENDAPSNNFQIAGTSGGDNVAAGRNVFSNYIEVVVPVTDSVELDIAYRYDKYSDFGNTTNPKVAVAWRPTDDLLLRASFGEGFRAPDMGQLYGNQNESFNGAVDWYQCAVNNGFNVTGTTVSDIAAAAAANGWGGTCATTQYRNFTGGNPDLDAETSDGFSVGAVWNPIDDFTIGLNYYELELQQQIGTLGVQTQLNRDYAARAAGGSYQFVTRGTNNQVISVQRTAQNLEGIRTAGYDLDVAYKLDAGDMGEFNFVLEYSMVDYFETRVLPTDPWGELTGVVGVPDNRWNLAIDWTIGDFTTNLITGFVEESGTDGGVQLDSWTTYDLQVAYSTPWDARIIIGARNITDEDPPVDMGLGHPNYSSSLHDIFGRVPYVRYEQNF